MQLERGDVSRMVSRHEYFMILRYLLYTEGPLNNFIEYETKVEGIVFSE